MTIRRALDGDSQSLRRKLRIALAAMGALAIAATTLAAVPSAAAKAGATMSMHDTPKPLPAVGFEGGDGVPRTLADFRGKVVLLNIWATWCGPCRHEMPTLDRLQAELGGPGFEVVALSIDRAGIEAVTASYAEVGVQHLAKYIDESGNAARQLNALGLPTTLLIDRVGREIGRLVGPAAWDTPQMVAFLRKYLAKESSTVLPDFGRVWAWRSSQHPALLRAPPWIARPPGLDLPVTGYPTSSATIGGNFP